MIALTGVILAGFEENFVELTEFIAVRPLVDIVRQCREVFAVFAGADFVEHLAKAVDISLRQACAFGWNVSFCPDKRLGVLHIGDQPDVRKLGQTVNENDVGGLYIPVNKARRSEGVKK